MPTRFHVPPVKLVCVKFRVKSSTRQFSPICRSAVFWDGVVHVIIAPLTLMPRSEVVAGSTISGYKVAPVVSVMVAFVPVGGIA